MEKKRNHCFLKAIKSKCHRLFCEQKAVEVMCFVPKRCNDMMNVGRLQGFEVTWRISFTLSTNRASRSAQANRNSGVLCSFGLGFQGKITALGKLLQQDTFTVTEQDSSFLSRAKERRIFLFEQLVIFSEPIDRKKGFSLPGYTFKNSIKVSVPCLNKRFIIKCCPDFELSNNQCLLHNPAEGTFTALHMSPYSQTC